MRFLSRRHADFVGILSAVLCLVHCLVVPILFGGYLHAHDVDHAHEGGVYHLWDYVFLAFGFVAVWFSSRHTHGLRRVLLWASFVALALALVLGNHSEIFVWIAYAASASLITVHAINLRHWKVHFSPASS